MSLDPKEVRNRALEEGVRWSLLAGDAMSYKWPQMAERMLEVDIEAIKQLQQDILAVAAQKAS